ncbi:MAG: DUF6452 family protein [Lutibacter sp.]|uniref:DUF6452 family protein n=1 Tax=Lutibacter sp. TaxID=1925666 RepID=UPI00385BF708
MKKYFTIITISLFTILSCEKDDICIEATTPNLIIRFYNDEVQTDSKIVDDLTVWADGKDSLYVNQALDSIIIPLDLTQNTTTLILANNLVNDTIAFSYDRKDIFVSRSCGYKTIFENLQIANNSSNWIKNIEINNSTIENDTAAHITIFH